MDEIEGPGGKGSFSIVRRQAPEQAQPPASDAIEGSGPDGKGGWAMVRDQAQESDLDASIDRNPAQERAQAIALIGMKMDENIMATLGAAFDFFTTEMNPQLEGKVKLSVPPLEARMRVAIRKHLITAYKEANMDTASLEEEVSTMEKTGKIEGPEDLSYIGPLIDGVVKVKSGEAKEVEVHRFPYGTDESKTGVRILLGATGDGTREFVHNNLVITTPTELDVDLKWTMDSSAGKCIMSVAKGLQAGS